MSSINKASSNAIFTHEGGKAKHITPIQQLRRSVMSCLLWESGFYEDGVTIAKRIEDLVATLTTAELAPIILEAKEQMKLRHVPLYLLSLATKLEGGNAMVGALLPGLVTRPDDMTEFLAMYWQEKHRPIPRQIKKGLSKAIKKFDEYSLAKYNGGNKKVKLRDLLMMVHPKPDTPAQSALWKRILEGTLATPDTWEVALSAGQDKAETWRRLLAEKKLGGLALLRNLRNMEKAGLTKEERRDAIAGVNSARLLPINFIAAARHDVQNEDILEEKFLELFTGSEKLLGRTILLVDVSGSMSEKLSAKSEMTRLDVACGLAMIAREKFHYVDIFTFDNQLYAIAPRHGFALRDAIRSTYHGDGTQLGGAIRHINTNGLPYNRIIVITDEQSADRVPNPLVNTIGYMINIASNKNGVGYHAWNHIDGWSDKVIDYIEELEGDNSKEHTW